MCVCESNHIENIASGRGNSNTAQFNLFNCCQTLNKNKINYVCPRIGTLLILTVSQLAKPLTYTVD